MYTLYHIRILFLFIQTLQPRYVLVYKHLIPAGHTVSSDIRNSASCDTTDLHENAMLKQAPAVDHPHRESGSKRLFSLAGHQYAF